MSEPHRLGASRSGAQGADRSFRSRRRETSASLIDVAFDLRSDSGGRDPDAWSPTLRRYHQLLWSKELPSGEIFHLDGSVRPFLRHSSRLGGFTLTSDTAVTDFRHRTDLAHITGAFPLRAEGFSRLRFSIGGMLVFPGTRIDRKNTINGARGFNPRIGDRLDLTLESIRRQYLGQENPLARVLGRYWDFFQLFGSFRGYIDFFLLQDAVAPDYSSVRFHLPFSDFGGSAFPADRAAYGAYLREVSAFITARNARIAEWVGASSN